MAHDARRCIWRHNAGVACRTISLPVPHPLPCKSRQHIPLPAILSPRSRPSSPGNLLPRVHTPQRRHNRRPDTSYHEKQLHLLARPLPYYFPHLPSSPVAGNSPESRNRPRIPKLPLPTPRTPPPLLHGLLLRNSPRHNRSHPSQTDILRNTMDRQFNPRHTIHRPSPPPLITRADAPRE